LTCINASMRALASNAAMPVEPDLRHPGASDPMPCALAAVDAPAPRGSPAIGAAPALASRYPAVRWHVLPTARARRADVQASAPGFANAA
jgi:hypothetical protein